jgi:hypothetical protein
MPLNRVGLTSDMIPYHRQEAFTKVVEMRSRGRCWPFLLSTGSHGYGQFYLGEYCVPRSTTAHRVAYVLWVGPIAPAMTIDHDRSRCGGGICCNPAHLRQLPNELNAKDNGQNLKTHCPQGHPYDQANTYISPRGDRRCRTCARNRYLPTKENRVLV